MRGAARCVARSRSACGPAPRRSAAAKCDWRSRVLLSGLSRSDDRFGHIEPAAAGSEGLPLFSGQNLQELARGHGSPAIVRIGRGRKCTAPAAPASRAAPSRRGGAAGTLGPLLVECFDQLVALLLARPSGSRSRPYRSYGVLAARRVRRRSCRSCSSGSLGNAAGGAWPDFAARPINPLVAQAFTAHPPTTVVEAAQRYADVLLAVDKQWQAGGGTRREVRPEAPPAALPSEPEEHCGRSSTHPTRRQYAVRPVRSGPAARPAEPAGARQAGQSTLRATGQGSRSAAPPMVLLDFACAAGAVHFRPRQFRTIAGRTVPRQFLQILAGEQRQAFRPGSGRLDLAEAIVRRDNPLTALVIANRIWQAALRSRRWSARRADFGLRIEPPTHPELLDYTLATTLIGRLLVDQETAPAHSALGHVSTSERRTAGRAGHRSRERAAVARQSAAAGF